MQITKATALALGVLSLDQLTKLAVGLTMSPGDSVALAGHWVRLTLVRNPGGAFGLLPAHGTLLLALSIAVFLVAGWVLLTGKPNWIPRPGVALLWAGTTGNLIDRVRWGHVLDFVQVPHWPVFNVADTSIVVGAALIAWRLVRRAD